MAYLNYNQQNQQQQQGMTSPSNQIQQPTTGAAPVVSSGQITPSAPQQTQQQQARQSQKGSGQFVNLRGYIQQNQPKAQEISGAIGQNIGQQAQQIGQQVQKQQQDLSARIAENQGRIAEQQQFGQQQINAARLGQAELAGSDVDRFRKIVEGSENFGVTQGLNTGDIQQGIGELARYTKNIEQQPVRNELLRSTFLKTGQYGAGQRALDDMLLSSSKPAMQNLIQSTEGELQKQRSGLTTAQEQAGAQQAALRQLAQQTQQTLTSGVEEKTKELEGTVKQRAEQLTKERDSLLKGLQQGKLTRQQAEQLGLSEGQMLFGQSGSGTGMSAAQSNEYLAQLANKLGMSIDQLVSNKTGLGGIDYSSLIGGIKTNVEDVLSKEEETAASQLAKLANQQRMFQNANIGGYEKTKAEQFQSLKNALQQAQLNYDKTARDIALKNAAYGVGAVSAPQMASDKAALVRLGLERIKDTGSGLDINLDPYTMQTLGAENLLSKVAVQRPSESGGVSWSAPQARVSTSGGVDIVSNPNQSGYSGGVRAGTQTLGTVSASDLKNLTGYSNLADYGYATTRSAAQAAYDEALAKVRESLRPQTLQYIDEPIAKDGGIMESKYSRWGRLRGKIK